MKKVLLVALAMVLVSSLILSGCAAPAPGPAPAPAPAPDEETPQYGGTFTHLALRMPNMFGWPPKIRGGLREAASLSLEGLLGVDFYYPGLYVPVLAESWELAPDKSAYIFHLRQGAKFHDGTDFNADAVKWNIGQYVGSPSPLFSAISSIEVIDDYTIKFNLTAWDRTILNDFANPMAYIYSPTAFDKNGEEWALYNPIGTGPFVLTEFVQNVSLEWERNEDYWGGRPYLDGVRMITAADPMTATAMFLNHEADFMQRVDFETRNQLLAQRDDWEFLINDGIGNMVAWNSKDPDSIFADIRVRQALEYAIDKKRITSTLFEGSVEPMYEILNGVSDLGIDPGTTLRLYDPEKAKQLLAEAGYPDGFKVKFLVGNMPRTDQWVAAQAMLADVGIEMEIQSLDMATWTQHTMAVPPANVMLWEHNRSRATSMSINVKEHWQTTSIHYSGLQRPEGIDDLVNTYLHTEDEDEANKLLGQMEKLLYDDAVCLVLWPDADINVLHPDSRVHDPEYFMPFGNRYRDWSKIWKGG